MCPFPLNHAHHHTPLRHPPLPVYRQMAGRAGRAGLDTEGEAIMVCKHPEAGKVRELLCGSMPPTHSHLVGPALVQRWEAGGVGATEAEALLNAGEAKGLTQAVLSAVACGLLRSSAQLDKFAGSTLLVSLVRGVHLPFCVSSSQGIGSLFSFLCYVLPA